ncbi:MAG: type III pantothenate kinase [Chloroflexaceae bacterium]|nr:type III pantothenate kinase [Chloroflexaceae bacterium]NJO07005.1 type III pantothenate kinase [Chloroflexaceae bacterium]
MLLAVDIGNTNIKLGVYEGERLLRHWRIATQRFRLADEYAVLVRNLMELSNLHLTDITGCAISCVVPPLTSQFRELAETYLHVSPFFAGLNIKTGLTFDIETPHELGSDRIANSVAVHQKYTSTVIAIAFGTATAFDVITAEGVYTGGAIAPGIGISADALFQAAARLYQVELVRPPHVIAKNTVHYMQSGLILGYTGLVEGLVSRMKAELNTPCTVVATGGLADVIAGETRAIDAVEPYLTLEGLRIIYELNTH